MPSSAVKWITVDILRREDELEKDRRKRKETLEGEEYSYEKSTHVVGTLSTYELKTYMCMVVYRQS